MAWEENPRICLHMQLIAILSRTEVLYTLSVLFVLLLFFLFLKTELRGIPCLLLKYTISFKIFPKELSVYFCNTRLY